MKQLLFIITIFSLISCRSDNHIDSQDGVVDADTTEVNSKMDSLEKESVSNYDMSTVDEKHSEEFMESLVKIEKQHGAQWSFCECIIKNDSINKALQDPSIGDAEFDKLVDRSDVIEKKCQAFLAQSLSQTPEERDEHERKVRKCLKEAGIK